MSARSSPASTVRSTVPALSARGEGAQAADAGVAELNEFVGTTQAQLDDIERRLVTFRQLRTRLGEGQTRLVPLSPIKLA